MLPVSNRWISVLAFAAACLVVDAQAATPRLATGQGHTLAVDAQGSVTGSHSNGCAYNGRVQIPDPNHNMLRLDVEISGCGGLTSSRSWNGKYEGLGMLKSGGVLYHSLIGSTWFGPQAPAK